MLSICNIKSKIEKDLIIKVLTMDQEVKFNHEQESEYPIDEQAILPDSEDAASLVHQAKNFKALLDQFKNEPFLSRPHYYLISAKWLRRWKIYVSYDSAVAAAPPNKFLGRGTLPKINENIVIQNPDIIPCFDGLFAHLNVVLKNGLQEEKDFIFATQEMWQLFQKYQHIQIKRFVQKTHDGKKIELYYQIVNLVPIYGDFLRQIERQKAHKLMQNKIQISHYIQIREFENLVKFKLRDYVSANAFASFPAEVPVRMWLMPEDTQPNILVNVLLTGCKANPSFMYKLYTDGLYMDQEQKICDFDIHGTSLILVEMKDIKDNWIFWNYKKPFTGQCGNCKSNEELKFVCSCKFALYCSKDCKSKDKHHHKFRCPNDCESDEEEVEITFNDHSRHGLVGLRNLGNTCFMNSGLQCLSHINELTQYFLSDKYINEINKENKLGTKGELSTAYAKLLKNLWMGSESSVSPTQLKRAIGKYQPMFMGYNQHDSGELVSYLLDGIHEDLNRIKDKPYTQTKDYDGRPDFEVAKQAWETYLKRNSSVIVDHMFGQFKSIVDCPNCQFESIQFDPFLICTLPIVNDNLKKMEVIYLRDHLYMTPLTICYDASWGWKMENILEEVKKKLGLDPAEKLVSYVTSYSVGQPISPTETVAYVEDEHKYRHIYVRKQLPQQNPAHDIPIILANVICHSHYGNETYRKNITPYRLYYLPHSATLKDVHHRLYSYYKDLYPVENYEEQVINVPEKQQPFRFLTIPASRFSKCEYCYVKGCEGCRLKYTDEQTLNDIVRDGMKKIQMELYWRKNDKEIQKKLDDIKSNDNNGQQKESKKKSGTTIQDCFKLFEEAEILGEENAWYCPKCKDFVLAKKQMQIYKAPKVLVLCLKRFKRKQYYAEKFNIMVDFPLKDFDISKYVLNHNLPEDYFKGENEQNSQKGSLVYDLIGITNHFGGTGGGHYTAYCLDQRSQNWYDFDDSCVSQLRCAEDAVTESAYMLYYRRRD